MTETRPESALERALTDSILMHAAGIVPLIQLPAEDRAIVYEELLGSIRRAGARIDERNRTEKMTRAASAQRSED